MKKEYIEDNRKMLVTVGIDKFEIDMEEFENLKRLIRENKMGLAKLKNGELINISSIVSIKHKPIW